MTIWDHGARAAVTFSAFSDFSRRKRTTGRLVIGPWGQERDRGQCVDASMHERGGAMGRSLVLGHFLARRLVVTVVYLDARGIQRVETIDLERLSKLRDQS